VIDILSCADGQPGVAGKYLEAEEGLPGGDARDRRRSLPPPEVQVMKPERGDISSDGMHRRICPGKLACKIAAGWESLVEDQFVKRFRPRKMRLRPSAWRDAKNEGSCQSSLQKLPAARHSLRPAVTADLIAGLIIATRAPIFKATQPGATSNPQLPTPKRWYLEVGNWELKRRVVN